MEKTVAAPEKLRKSDWHQGQLVKLVTVAAIALVCLFASGCASIVDAGPRNVRIDSTPSGAKFTVYDKTGRMVESKTTPATVRLRSDESFFKGQDYRVVFEEPGYCPVDLRIKSEVNGWFYGNLFFGGLVGMVIDGVSGAMWSLSPADIKYDLVPTPANEASLKPDPPAAVQSEGFKNDKEPNSNQR